MLKTAPLTCFGVAALFFGYAAYQYANVSAGLTDRQAAAPAVSLPQDRADAPPRPPRPASGGKSTDVSVHQSVIRCLGDLDDLLDTVHDPASFEAVKPKLLDRLRQQAALAAAHPGQGMVGMSRSAALAMQKAVNRHTEAIVRANEVAPGVTDFFAKEMAAVLNAK
jgi:hypothetical protein